MTRWLLLLTIASVLLMTVPSLAQVPADGMYATFSTGILQQWGAQMALYLADEANTYKSTPDYNGQTDDATYTFSQFIYDIDLESFTYSYPGKQQWAKGVQVYV
jgi:hypothetical protein